MSRFRQTKLRQALPLTMPFSGLSNVGLLQIQSIRLRPPLASARPLAASPTEPFLRQCLDDF